jgi:hypothetical protein
MAARAKSNSYSIERPSLQPQLFPRLVPRQPVPGIIVVAGPRELFTKFPLLARGPSLGQQKPNQFLLVGTRKLSELLLDFDKRHAKSLRWLAGDGNRGDPLKKLNRVTVCACRSQIDKTWRGWL